MRNIENKRTYLEVPMEIAQSVTPDQDMTQTQKYQLNLPQPDIIPTDLVLQLPYPSQAPMSIPASACHTPARAITSPPISEVCPIDGRAHNYEKQFTCCGIALGVCCFPCGLYCLFSIRPKKCVKCKRQL